MAIYSYDRAASVNYAHTWARKRNPKYGDFSKMGGDCTNFISQCLFAGTEVMNHTKDTGWYYYSLNSRAPAWSGVVFLYNFLTSNKGQGPFGREVSMLEAQEGDIAQLALSKSDFEHTVLIVSIGRPRALGSILVATHSIDSDDRPLNTYEYQQLRFIHIDGCRK
jgi:hypothetical protein